MVERGGNASFPARVVGVKNVQPKGEASGNDEAEGFKSVSGEASQRDRRIERSTTGGRLSSSFKRLLRKRLQKNEHRRAGTGSVIPQRGRRKKPGMEKKKTSAKEEFTG